MPTCSPGQLLAHPLAARAKAERGRPHSHLYEVALWADMWRVQGDELFYAYMIDNQGIVIPETIDAIRALTRAVEDASESIAMTNSALGIAPRLVGRSSMVTRSEVGSTR